MSTDATANYRASVAGAAEPPPSAAAAFRLAEALRRLGALAVGTAAPDAVLDEAAAAVDAASDRLAPYAEPSRYEQAQRLGGASGVFLNHPITGPVNPLAPRVVMRPDGERLLGRALYGTPYEGPPGAVHGGQIAAGFDAVLAMAGGINGRMGMTRSLSTRFLKPTPLHTELVYEAAIVAREERKTVVHGVLRAGDVVTAEGTGEFVFR